MANIQTTKIVVLDRILFRAKEQIDALTDETLWLSTEVEPPEAVQKSVFVTLVATNGRFESGLLGGGAEFVVGYEGGVAFTIYTRMKTGRYGHDGNLMLDRERGLFAMEQQLLRTFAGHMLEDEDGNQLLNEHMQPLTDDDPRRSNMDNPPGSIQVVFATHFDWDLTKDADF